MRGFHLLAVGITRWSKCGRAEQNARLIDGAGREGAPNESLKDEENKNRMIHERKSGVRRTEKFFWRIRFLFQGNSYLSFLRNLVTQNVSKEKTRIGGKGNKLL